MSGLPERESGILRMAFDLAWKTDWLVEMGPGLTASRREIGRFAVETEIAVGIADAARAHDDPARWHERRRARIVFEGLVVFDAWQSRVLGANEANLGLVVDFLPGPWIARLASLWNAERLPS